MKKYGDSVCMFVLIDINEQGLDKVRLAVFKLRGWTGQFAELIVNRIRFF